MPLVLDAKRMKKLKNPRQLAIFIFQYLLGEKKDCENWTTLTEGFGTPLPKV